MWTEWMPGRMPRFRPALTSDSGKEQLRLWLWAGSKEFAIWCWCQTQHPESPLPASVTHLLQQVSQHEDTIMEGIKNTLENPPPSVSAVSESMEDLEVEQADPSCGGEGCKETDCCRTADKMDQDVPQQPQRLCSGSTDCSSRSSDTLKYLLQRCMDLVSELGLPEDLVSHIQELNNV
ncbi:OTU deubiquitinase with linear linkage specificity a isoform X2 [Trematomus bernacchii]|uniref:OTU deubiquitinase with linear linkage specificity a isoform X2 n=1 Tax=Trematomus bernacchii TaxID=40690 RepID=UPI001469B7D7|nr:OTU deubiquitinase with linear linkage specificity a isoform X2 [Trematomus bernacchii]